MTTKYASPLAESQAKLAAARNAASQARIALNQTAAARLVADSAYEQWREQWPNIDKREGRPTYLGPEGLAVHSDGSPYLTESGLQANRPDVYCPPPPTDKTLAALAEVVTKAERKEATALKAEIKARAEHEPPTNTGWIVLKPKRIAGTVYAVGDSIDPTSVEPRKFEQFKSVGLVGHG